MARRQGTIPLPKAHQFCRLLSLRRMVSYLVVAEKTTETTRCKSLHFLAFPHPLKELRMVLKELPYLLKLRLPRSEHRQ